MSWYTQAMGKVHDEVQEYLTDQPMEAVNDIAEQILSNIKNYYYNDEPLYSGIYNLSQPHNEFIDEYQVEVSAMQSNNDIGSHIANATVQWLQIKIYNKERIEDSCRRKNPDADEQAIQECIQQGFSYNISRLEKDLDETLLHEMGHYYIEKKRGAAEDLDYHEKGMEHYFMNKEELPLHARSIWNKIQKRLPDIFEKDPERIERIIRRNVENFPHTIGFHHLPFPKRTQNEYFKHIWKHYVKPNLV